MEGAGDGDDGGGKGTAVEVRGLEGEKRAAVEVQLAAICVGICGVFSG